MSKSSVYTFTVEKPGDIDYTRICRECGEDGHDAVVVTHRPGTHAVVMLSDSFCYKHSTASVAGCVVSRWTDWVGESMWLRHYIVVADIGKVIQEIRAIKERVPLFKVNVHCIEAKARPEQDDLPRYEKRDEPAVKRVGLGTLKELAYFRFAAEDRTVWQRLAELPNGIIEVRRWHLPDTDVYHYHRSAPVIPVTATFTNETE